MYELSTGVAGGNFSVSQNTKGKGGREAKPYAAKRRGFRNLIVAAADSCRDREKTARSRQEFTDIAAKE